MRSYKQLSFLWLAIGIFCSTFVYASNKEDQIDSLITKAHQLQYVHVDSAIGNYIQCLNYFIEIADTNRIIEARMYLLEKYSGKGQYQLAYDQAWLLVPLVELEGFDKEKVDVFRSIAILYTVFEQYEKAFFYLEKSISQAEYLDIEEQAKYLLLCELYSAKAWLVTESSKDLDTAEKLRLKALDLSIKGKNELTTKFQKMHLAQLYIEMKRLDEAGSILKTIHAAVPNNGLYPIHSLLCNYLGNYHYEIGEIDSAIVFYNKSIKAIETHQNHLNIEIETLERLSKCYALTNQNILALNCLKDAKTLDEKIFGSRSLQNKTLFEIKDQYAAQLQAKEEKIKSQRLELLEREKQLWIIRSILFLLLAIAVIVILITRYRRILHKKEVEKELLEKKKELESQKQAEIIEVKNKELMTSALKLIERDTHLDEIKKFLDELDAAEKNKSAIKKMSQSILFDRSKKWEEFDLYFNTVNNSFYAALKKEFSKLTSTDLKMCALIKLGFSSKEMSQIMSIGVDGINVSRSRIRKKMGLSRETNLLDFLQTFEI